MKAAGHPTWNTNITVTCACGATFTTGSTMGDIRVEICSKCHPLFTGQQKFVDTLGQVERFERRKKEAEKKSEEKRQIVEARKARSSDEKKDKPSLKDLLMQARKGAARS
jgi:large subunit ribosomal protein L31